MLLLLLLLLLLEAAAAVEQQPAFKRGLEWNKKEIHFCGISISLRPHCLRHKPALLRKGMWGVGRKRERGISRERYKQRVGFYPSDVSPFGSRLMHKNAKRNVWHAYNSLSLCLSNTHTHCGTEPIKSFLNLIPLLSKTITFCHLNNWLFDFLHLTNQYIRTSENSQKIIIF